jgi:hypothetical protein
MTPHRGPALASQGASDGEGRATRRAAWSSSSSSSKQDGRTQQARLHGPRRPVLRGSGALLFILGALCTLRRGTCVPLGWRDLEDDGSVPPAHYPTKNLDLSKPRPMVDDANGGFEYEPDAGAFANQKRAPPHSRGGTGANPRQGKVESLYEERGRNPGEEEGGTDSEDVPVTSVWNVAFNTLLMAVASGFGAAPFFVVSHVNRKVCVSACLYLSVSSSVCVPLCISVSVCLPACLPACLSVCLCLCFSLSLSLSLSL